ncbi:MAG: glycerol-3-phosphate acyltransferase, partial [Bacillota bacterium]
PLLNRFKGGRGLATTMGTIGVINLPKGLLAFIMGVIISLILRQHLKRDIRIWQVVYPFFIILFLYPVFNIYKIIYGMGIIFIASIRTWQIRSE